MTKQILVTGASGFVGRQLMMRLASITSADARGAMRAKPAGCHDNVVSVGEINGNTDWSAAIQGCSIIIHAAARAHIMDDTAADPLTEFRSVNVAGTLNLARQAAKAGIRRFVFISSIKVNGEQTELEGGFTVDGAPAPQDPYGISKLEAEQGLHQIARETGIEVVIIRPPLVYGPGMKGNFANMVKLVGKGLPLPLGAVHNKRSLVALDNLVDLIITCTDHLGAANQTFLVSDGEDLSTTQLLKGIAQAMGKPSRLVPVPASFLQFGAKLLGKRAIAQRLLGSLQVDISYTRDRLGWTPPLTVRQGLERCFENC